MSSLQVRFSLNIKPTVWWVRQNLGNMDIVTELEGVINEAIYGGNTCYLELPNGSQRQVRYDVPRRASFLIVFNVRGGKRVGLVAIFVNRGYHTIADFEFVKW